MNIGPRVLCVALAALLFAVATLWAPTPPAGQPPRFNLIAAGLTFLALAQLFP
jgi:hypothetical protein